MGNKFAVPGGVCLVAVAPVQYELRQHLLGELAIDMRQFENIEYVGAGEPVVADALWFGAVAQARGIARPLHTNVLHELAVEALGVCAFVLPVQHEFRDGLLDEIALDFRAQ